MTSKKRIYLCSTVGQLYKSKSFIKSHPEEKAVLIFGYTIARLPDYDHIREEAKGYFDECHFVRFTRKNQEINIFRVAENYRRYKKILDTHRPNYVTLFSFEHHYSLFCSLCEQRGIPLTIAEEGTGSYKFFIIPEEKTPAKKKPSAHIKHLYNSSWKKTYFGRYILRPIYKIIRIFLGIANAIILEFINIIASLIKTITYLFTLESFSYKIIAKSKKFSPFLSTWKKFDTVRLEIPGRLETYFDSNQIIINPKQLQSEHDGHVAEAIEKNNFNSDSIIFASQNVWGIPSDQLLEFVLPILSKISMEEGKEIFIKTHPKENMSLIRGAIENYDNPRIKIFEDCPYPFELIVKMAKPHAVVSIGSSSLVYSYHISPETRYISISKDVYPQLKSAKKVTKGVKKFFDITIPTMELFDHIQFTEYSKEQWIQIK